MKGKNKFLLTTTIISILMILTAVILSTIKLKNVDNTIANLKTAENLRAMNYEQATDETAKVENSENVRFTAFFTRDLDGDGNAEKLLGTCRELNATDTLYMDINVLTDGYLENGVIEIHGSNFNYSMNMVKDSVLKYNYLSDNVKNIKLNKINAGTQKLIIGNVLANVGNNINNYSNISSITLKGTHVSDDGQKRTDINKTIDITVDWYGRTSTSIYASGIYYNIEEFESDTISFNFTTYENSKELLLQENTSILKIPNLNGHAPVEVICTNSNVEFNYDAQTQKVTIKRTSSVNEDGEITSKLATYNSYNIVVKYPQEAYEQISSYTQLKIPIETYYTGYNNPNEEFEDPYKSNIAKATISVVFREKPKGNIYNFYVYIKDKTYVSRPNSRYVITKQDILNAFDSAEPVENKKYTVEWFATRGSEGEVESLIMSETKQSENQYGDKIDSTIIDNYAVNTGIYFSNATNMLGENGTISVYNDENNELIKTFTKEDWEKYTKDQPFMYDVPVKHIRVETSAASVSSNLSVYHLKELNIEKIKEDYTKEQVEEMQLLTTHLTGICNIVGQNAGKVNDIDSAYLVSEVSNANISLSNSKFITQDTYNNQKIYIDAKVSQLGDAKWQNGIFVVEMPAEILNMDINSVVTNNENVEILAYELAKDGDKYFIKIFTQNEQPEEFRITVSAKIVPNPTIADKNSSVILYAYNAYCNEYYFKTIDKYDINSNNDVKDNVAYDSEIVSFVSPTGLITMETITNYDSKDKDKITIAPNVAEIEKEQKSATVNVVVSNNYPNSISDIKILGKIPFEGNTYILNKNDMNSKFSTTMTNEGINIPQELKDKIVIYYSENMNPTIDLSDSKNGWKLLENVDDFSKIKTYLIDFKDYNLNILKSYTFSYNINIPENVQNNIISYSDHAVYYNLETEGGKLQLSTEPNKVGIKVVKKFNFELNKTKENFETLKVAGALYKIEYEDTEGNVITKILATDVDGKIKLDDLYVGLKYKVQEISAPDNYVINNDVFEFEIFEDERGNLKMQTTNTNIVFDEEKETVSINTNDEPKYSLKIVKVEKNTNNRMSNVKFEINGKLYNTDSEGEILLERLERDVEYKLTEIGTDGYYMLDKIIFKLVKDEDGNLIIESNNEDFKNAVIENTDKNDLINVQVNLTNEKIPTYTLEVYKVEKNAEENLKPLKGAKFNLEYQDLEIGKTFETDENGKIVIDNLYQYVEGKYILGTYVLQEIEAPEGYVNNAEEIGFRVSKNAEGKLTVEIENEENIDTIKDIQVDGDIIKIIIEDLPLFKMTKIDAETKEILPNVKFILYEIDEEYNVIDFAKGVNGNYVGQINENGEYVVDVNENGSVSLPLKEGLYKAVEIEFPEGYEDEGNDAYFEISTNGKEINDEDVIEINYIEDLVDLSNNVKDGTTYSGRTIKLMRNLDFYNNSSYRNVNSTAYGDYNSNDSVEDLKTELTTGHGFQSIGNYKYSFYGTFDGQGYEIKNLIQPKYYESMYHVRIAGLFGYVNNATIKNLTVSGDIYGVNTGFIASNINNSIIDNCSGYGNISGMGYRGNSSCGAIVGYAMNGSIINNCSLSKNFSINPDGAANYGGIVGSLENSTISNCKNTVDIDYRGNIAGIVYNILGNCIVNNCYNTGNIYSYGYGGSGGILGTIDYSSYETEIRIINCCNTGNINVRLDKSVGGIVGYINSSSKEKLQIDRCYNIGSVNGGQAGGIVGNIYSYAKIDISNCYNKGNIYGNYIGGGIAVKGYEFSDTFIKNCYTSGDIKVTTDNDYYNVGTIVGIIGEDNTYNIENTYYLESIEIQGPQILELGTPVSDQYMKTREFYNKLNIDNAWIYRENLYPRLHTGPTAKIQSVQELIVENRLKKFKITTEIAENSEENRVGGTISGVYNDEYSEENNIKYVEEVKYKLSNSQKIEIKPNDDYCIDTILVNGEKIEYTVNSNGEVILPSGYFTDILEDKHIVVIFERKTNLIITKVDEDNNNIKLSGAKFKIDDPIVNTVDLNNLIGTIAHAPTSTTQYHFEKVGDKYVSTNTGVSNSVASSYMPIDLTNYSGKDFTLNINASISSENVSYDYGYARITTTSTIPSYSDTTGQIFKIGGTNIETNTYSTTLEGGKLYYLHLGYRKDGSVNSGDDKFTINSINLTYNGNQIMEEIVRYEIIEVETNAEGKAFARVSTDNDFTITEIKAPFGYNLNSTPINLTVSPGEVKELTITNKKIDSKLKLIKQDSQTNQPLSGAEFYLSNIYNIKQKSKLCTEKGENQFSSNKQIWNDIENRNYQISLNTGTATLNSEGELVLDGNTTWNVNNWQEGSFGTYEISVAIDKDFKPVNTTAWYLASCILGGELPFTQKDFALIIDKNGYFAVGYSESTIYSSNVYALDGEYHTLTLVYAQNYIKFVIDGNVITTISYTPTGNNLTKIGIGWNADGTGTAIKGTIRNVKIYNEILTEQEIMVSQLNDNNTVSDELFETTLKTNDNGEAEIPLSEGVYILKETKAPEGYELNEERQIITIANTNQEIIVKNTPKKIKITTKVERTPTQQVDGGTISGKDEQPYEEVTYAQTSTKDILIDPDDGYQIKDIKINGEQLEFTPDKNGNVLLDKFTDMKEDKEVIVRFEPVYEPNFTLVKKDEYTNEPLEGIQFAVYYLSVGNDFAKDKNGYYIGQKDENGMYIVTTDANGEVKLSLPTGLYKAIEVKGANGYVLPEKEEDRTTYFRVVAEADTEINYIEDLIELSNNVTNGNTYEGKVVGLARDLDFNDVNSYRNANDMTTYGDYNGDKIVESIKDELTNISGCGFKPIGGTTDKVFSGVFDGNGFELKNIYINTKYSALFAHISNGELLNLKLINANIINSNNGAGFAYNATYSKIYNCGIDGVLNSTTNYPTAGIVYTTNNSEIINCYNNADISGVCTAGISSNINNSLIENCYNAGNLISTGPIGGIGYFVSKSIIKNCYNTGNITGKGCSGGIAEYITESVVENCYNTGKINDSSAPAGGLAYSIYKCNISNFYNIGDVFGNAGAGGISQSISSSNLENCYNEGNISSINSGASGFGLYISDSSLKKCYNTGNISSVNNIAGGFSGSVSNSSFEECYNTGNVISEYSTSGETNGAVGFAITFINSTAEKCFNEGNVSSKYCGAGFALRADNSDFEKCYNKGEITATNALSGFINIGNNCNLINVYNKGNLIGSSGDVGGIAYSINGTYLEKCFNEGNLYSGPSAGGLVNSCTESTIIKCYNSGITKAGGLAGGLTRYNTNSLIQDCYNIGEVYSGAPAGGISYGMTGTTINNCYNLGTVHGYGIGGIVNSNNNNSNCKINNCYNAGKLIQSSSSSTAAISGIIASINGQLNSVKNTYYLKTTANYGIGTSEDVIYVAESKGIMQMISKTFVNELNNNKKLIETTIPLSNWRYNSSGYPVLDFEIDMYEYDIGSEEENNSTENIEIENIINADIKIMYIEDLIDLSNNVTNGNTYEGKVISLVRNLDFKDVNSYRNANDTISYGDYNGNGMVETIQDELTNIASIGFKPIGGNTDKTFSGVFKGNGFEIKNLYIKTNYGALFTHVSNGEISDLKLTNANIINSSCGAGFAYYATNAKIYNCGIDGLVKSSNNTPTSGIVYTTNDSEIKDCYNNAEVSGVYTAGISSYINNSLIENCYNTGKITSTGPTGGIGYNINNSTLNNCYNTGEINGRGTSGGIASYISNSQVENCYNTGNVTDTSSPAGGLAYEISKCSITNFYNTGDISGCYGAGGIAQSIKGSSLEKCYNKGNLFSINSNAAGIAIQILDSSFKECYNKGNVSSEYTTQGDTNGASGFAITFTNSTAEKCFNEGKVVSKMHATGFALRAEGSNLEQCYNKGNIQAPNFTAGLVYVSVDSNCKNSYNKGIVIGGSPNAGLIYTFVNGTMEQCANFGVVKTEAPAGGVVYYVSNANIIKCYNSGEVYGPSCAGGVVYTASNSLIQDCYNDGKVYSTVPAGGVVYNLSNSIVNNCYNTGNVLGNYCIGGVVEYTDSNSRINNCYNAGDLILGTGSTGEPIGGIVYGASIDILKNTYYLDTTAESGIYNILDVEGKTESKTAEQMTSQEFVNQLNDNKNLIETTILLSDWKFNNNGYPVLDYAIDMYEYNTDSKEEITKPIVIPNYEKVESELSITNSKSAKIIVHHYLEGTGPEFENEPTVLASDEIVMGKENYEYITAPNLNIEGYTLIQDVNGEYIIPENAIGRFTVEDQHIYYYYNVKPLELIVHHYLEGTEDKLADDEQYFYNENDHYKTTASEEVLKSYDLVEVVGDEEKDITQNEVVTYYYKKKEYKVTTKVVIPEAEAEAGRTENGGTILGEGEDTYEIVKHGENSKNDIIATPDEGYRLGTITVNGKVVPFTTKDGKTEIEKFENMTEDKEVIVTFIPTNGKVITHHYIQGTTEKLHDDIINIDKVGAVVSTSPIDIKDYKLVDSVGNKDEDGNVVIVREIHEGVEEIIYYYQRAYIITTDVIEHKEKYKDGTEQTGIKGGNITNEDVVIHEQVIKYEDSVKVIEMKPDDDYEVIEVRVNGQVVTFEKAGSGSQSGSVNQDGVEMSTKLELDENGNLVIPEGFFTNVQKDIHVEVQYRRKSKVIVKYLENNTEKVLAEETEIVGYEGKKFETAVKIIPGYTLVMEVISNGNQEETIKITDENYKPTQPNGTMFSDDITVIYWYKKIDANVIERHIEIDAKGEEKEIEFIVHNDDTAVTVETLRKEYEGYSSTNAPEETKEKVENEFGNIIFVDKKENKSIVTVDSTNVKEVWYYYIKQYNITTEVKPHKQSINGIETEVDGGTISKQFKIDENGKEVEDVYEVVDNRADSTKEIKMVPEDGYRIKSVIINDEEIYIDNMVAEDGSLLLPVAYFKDVQKDYHVVVEYEKIPAKVIVKYIDEYTKESILPDKVIDGFVNDEYNEPRVEIDSYIAVEPEPENSQGKMIDGVITIVYYYGKQYKITTDVIEHLEDKEKSIIDVIVNKVHESLDDTVNSDESNEVENGKDSSEEVTDSENGTTVGGSITVIPEGKILVKGGSIQGEDEEPYETVSRGKDNQKQILIKPDDGYRIKSVELKDGESLYSLSVSDLLTKENTIIIPVSYFKNMQSDKHLTVEFEQIPAKVIVNYLDIETKDSEKQECVSEQESGKGFVNYEYKTYEKQIPYYELVKEELPSNAQGKLTEKDTVVNYWYRKLLFNMKLTKEFSSIQVNGTEMLKDNNKFVKVDIANTEVETTNILVKYRITVTNTEEVEGIAKIVEDIPVGFKYVSNIQTENSSEEILIENAKWEEVDGRLELLTKTIKPGETVVYEVTLEWDKTQNTIGNLINTAKLTETQNLPNYQETTKDDNKDSCTLIIAIRTRENRDVKTIISMSCFILAGICTVIYIGNEVCARKKENE